MTQGEKTMLVVGLGLGLLPTLIIVVVLVRGQHPLGHGEQTMYSLEPDSGVEQSASAVVRLTDAEIKKIGIQTSAVQRGTVVREVVTPARVEELGAEIGTVQARVGGRVDRLFVTSVGERVRRDQPIALISSPELAREAEEYRAAARKEQSNAEQSDSSATNHRQRLESWGLSQGQIKDVILSPEKPVQVTLYAALPGVVRTENIAEGRYVSAGEVLMTLINLSTVSLRADIFESDIEGVRAGIIAEITSDVFPGVKLDGTVNSVESRSDALSGATQVHIRVENPGMRLKPGMFVRSVLRVPVKSGVLTVPRTAVIDTGTDKIVYVALQNGRFERRSIRVGGPGKENYPVLHGLVEGDKVVTNGAFLIDSQLRVTAGDSISIGSSGSVPIPGYRIVLRVKPDPPLKGTSNSVSVSVLNPEGVPLQGEAQVKLSVSMPAMPSMGMPEMHSTTSLRWIGSEYSGSINFAMAGHWNVAVEARDGSRLLAQYLTNFDAR